MSRRPVGRDERKVLEALHEATGALLAAENVAEAYFARIKVVAAIDTLHSMALRAAQRVEAKRER